MSELVNPVIKAAKENVLFFNKNLREIKTVEKRMDELEIPVRKL